MSGCLTFSTTRAIYSGEVLTLGGMERCGRPICFCSWGCHLAKSVLMFQHDCIEGVERLEPDARIVRTEAPVYTYRAPIATLLHAFTS